MANPDNLVTVSITIQDASVTATGFGTALIMTNETVFGPDLVRSYSSTAAMVTAGFSATGATVAAATAIFAQNPRPATIKVGRRTSTPSTQTKIVTVDTVLDDTDYTVTINGVAFTIDSGTSATNLTIATALFTAINAGGEPVTAVDNSDGTIDLTEDVDGVIFGLTLTRGGLLTQDDTTVAAAVAADYAAIKAEDNDFYGVILTSSSTLEIVALAAAVEADLKLFVVQSADDDILADTGGNLFETLNTAAYARTIAVWSENNLQYGNAAWMGKMFAKDPGAATWAYKTLAGVSADVLTDDQISNLEVSKGNYYTATKGLNLTLQGWASSGRFADTTRGVDWLKTRTQERLINLLANSDKIAYTPPGITALENELRAQLDEAVRQGVINADYTVTPPVFSTISSADKIARALGDLDFTATLTGAIHTVTIAGTVSA